MPRITSIELQRSGRFAPGTSQLLSNIERLVSGDMADTLEWQLGVAGCRPPVAGEGPLPNLKR